MMMIFKWNQWEQFIRTFSWTFQKKNVHEIFMNLIWMFHEPFRLKYDHDIHMKSVVAVHSEIFMIISIKKSSWNFHEFDMNVSWTLSIEIWSWYSYGINGSSSLGYFHDHFNRKMFMKFSWIWYECFMNPFGRNVIMIFMWNQWEQFIRIFSWSFQ